MHFLPTLLPLALTLSSIATSAHADRIGLQRREGLGKRCNDHSSSTAASVTSTALEVAPTSPSNKAALGGGGVFGFATLNGGTTGGAGGAETTVSDLSALRNAVEGDEAKVVYVSGIIEASSLPSPVSLVPQLTGPRFPLPAIFFFSFASLFHGLYLRAQGDGEVVDVGSNTSILPANGGGKDGLTGGGFRVKRTQNVIIRGLALSKSPAPTDLILVQEGTNVWVDGNTFESDLDHGKDYYDGQFDCTHACDFVTVSNNIFQNAYKTSLVGHSDSNSKEDTGHLRVTFASSSRFRPCVPLLTSINSSSYAYNLFNNVNSRLPSLRFGTGHIFYYKDILGSGINSRKGAEVLIEGNYFENSKKPVESSLKKGGVVDGGDNIFIDSDEPDWSVEGTISASDLGYTYTLEAGADIPALVTAAAGAANYA
ncbi:hypothetical protein JCM11251_003364 [Rhodosporidiobolus azoricus]